MKATPDTPTFGRRRPRASFVARRSKETKFVISPNLLLMQAANFCKLLMKRVDTLVSLLFYSLRLQSLGGLLTWVTDLNTRTTLFHLQIRDKLPPEKDLSGNKPKDDDARQVTLETGALPGDKLKTDFKLVGSSAPDRRLAP